MENFQLYRTNILLGGQMKWDLIIDNSSNGLVVTDLHLSPISSNIPYTYQSDENLFNHSHEDNVKSYYKSMEGYFYADGISPEFKHNWPVIVPAGTRAYTYNDVCDMGCRRMKHYDLYNKQFEFFCPIWLEHLSDDLKFEFFVSDSNMNVVSKRLLTVKKGDLTNKFNKYFNEYLDKCGILNGTDEVMMIDINDSTAYVTGLNVKEGLHVTKDISSIVGQLTLREQPLMEFDNTIISNISSNNMVVNQLFNFNFCFNLTDIVSGTVSNLMKGEFMSLGVNVYVGDQLLAKKDFDTEYEYIPKTIIYTDSSLDFEINALNYLVDHKCIDLIDKNKYSQPICHWSLCGCNDYIFNLYNGFSGYSISNGQVVQSDHQYGKTPSMDTIGYGNFINNTGWVNMFEFVEWADFYLFISGLRGNKSKFSVFDKVGFVNDIKYSKLPSNPIYYCGVWVDSKLYTKVVNNFEHKVIDGNLIAYESNDTIVFISDIRDDFTHRNMVDVLKRVKDCNPLLKSFIDVFLSFVTPSVVSLSTSVFADRISGPNYQSDEMVYYKDDSNSEYVIRYDGKIKPSFTESRTMYYKDYISDDRGNGESKLQGSAYGQFAKTGYEPLYKSIGYYSILSREMDYDNLPNVKVSEFDTEIPINNAVEYNWFNRGKMMSVKDEHKFTLIKTAQQDLETMVKEYLENYYDIPDATYVRSLYDITYNWEYYSNDNVTDYKVNITLKLK